MATFIAVYLLAVCRLLHETVLEKPSTSMEPKDKIVFYFRGFVEFFSHSAETKAALAEKRIFENPLYFQVQL